MLIVQEHSRVPYVFFCLSHIQAQIVIDTQRYSHVYTTPIYPHTLICCLIDLTQYNMNLYEWDISKLDELKCE